MHAPLNRQECQAVLAIIYKKHYQLRFFTENKFQLHRSDCINPREDYQLVSGTNTRLISDSMDKQQVR